MCHVCHMHMAYMHMVAGLQRAGRREVGDLREEISEERAQLRELVLVRALLAVVVLTEARGDLRAQCRAIALERRRVPCAKVRR
jgi:hypothetical protein